ncbi:MAG: cytosine permease [Proteobacteria bacterium]|nr:cytosine permease [Pseudomonadota bacterium]
MSKAREAAADTGVWPLLRRERTWGPWRLGIALATAAAATWCYLIGEYEGYYLNFFQGSLALTAGSMIGMLLVLLAAGPTCIRFGIESVASTKPQFGSRGWVIPALMQLLSIIGWNAMLLIFFAKSLTQLLGVLGWLPAGVGALQLVPFTTMIACAIVLLVLLWGASGVTHLSNILVAHVFVGFWMLYLLVSQRWPELVAARPALAKPDAVWNYTTGVEIGVTSLLSWWAYIGALIRMAPDGRRIAVPVMLGMGLPVPLLSLIGVAGILVLKNSDPSAWLSTVGGHLYAVVGLSFVAAANFGTAIAGIYASAIGLRNFRRLNDLPWLVVLLVTIMPVAFLGAFVPELVFNHFGTILALIGVCFAPLCGIQIADYYVLRHRRIDIRAIYETQPGCRYYFWGGFNPAAIVATVVGVALYAYLLNPLTYESHGPYRFLTASLPTTLVSGLVHVLLTRLLVIPARQGDYPDRARSQT